MSERNIKFKDKLLYTGPLIDIITREVETMIDVYPSINTLSDDINTSMDCINDHLWSALEMMRKVRISMDKERYDR